MKTVFDYNEAVLNTWKINNRTSVFLIENIPEELWVEKVPGSVRKTIGMVASHIHNTRCMWIKTICRDQVIQTPLKVDARKAGSKEVAAALNKSSAAMLKLLKACIENGGKLPSAPPWLNFPNDVVHFLTYLVSHESHHRGQIILSARQLNHRLPAEVVNGVWQWTRRLREAKI
jgi:uncharacterized damage-inducible protein DinB